MPYSPEGSGKVIRNPDPEPDHQKKLIDFPTDKPSYISYFGSNPADKVSKKVSK